MNFFHDLVSCYQMYDGKFLSGFVFTHSLNLMISLVDSVIYKSLHFLTPQLDKNLFWCHQRLLSLNPCWYCQNESLYSKVIWGIRFMSVWNYFEIQTCNLGFHLYGLIRSISDSLWASLICYQTCQTSYDASSSFHISLEQIADQIFHAILITCLSHVSSLDELDPPQFYVGKHYQCALLVEEILVH